MDGRLCETVLTPWLSRLLCLLLLGVFPPLVQGATMTWTNAAGGNWKTAANWSPNQVPGASDTALITNNGTYAVTVTDNEAVNTLMLGGASGTQTLSLSSGTFTLSGSGTGNAQTVVTIAGGTFTGAGALVLAGSLNWSGGTISGVVQCNGGAMSGGPRLNGGQVINSGTLNWTATDFYTGNGSALSNLASGIINLTANLSGNYAGWLGGERMCSTTRAS